MPGVHNQTISLTPMGNGSDHANDIPSTSGNHIDLEADRPPDPKVPLARKGYASLSEFIASDKCLYIFRRFNNLATRNLL
jgi:hypothetical protein